MSSAHTLTTLAICPDQQNKDYMIYFKVRIIVPPIPSKVMSSAHTMTTLLISSPYEQETQFLF